MHRTTVWSWISRGALGAVLAAVAYAAKPAADPADLAAVLGVRAAEPLTLLLPDDPATSFEIEVDLDGTPVTLAFAPHSVRAADHQVLERTSTGVRAVAPPVERTIRGHGVGAPQSRAAGALLTAGLRVLIIHNGQRYWIEPQSGLVPTARRADHVLYRAADVVPQDVGCAMLEPQFTTVGRRRTAGQDPCPGVGFNAAEVALEADFLYFLQYGSINDAVTQMETVINTMNLQYETQLDVTHVVTTTIVNTAADPYSTSDPNDLLCQFRNYWNDNYDSIVRDAAQLFTGRILLGPPVGIAWRGVVCNGVGIDPACPGGDNLAYSVVESNYNGINGAMACKTDLSAHELGHNWNADHCICSLFTMNATLGSCNNEFHPEFSLPEMVAFRNSRTCLQFVSDDIELEGILITPEADTVIEGGILNMDVFADLPDPPCIANVDIAGEVVWTVDPPGAGSLDSFARFFAGQVSADTLVALTAAYDGEYGQDEETVFITIEDTAVDERTVAIALQPTVDPTQLLPGQTFDVDVLLSAPLGDVLDLRLLQFDVLLTFGATVDEWIWQFDDLLNNSLYGLFVTGTVHSALYTSETPAEDLIVTLGAVPQRVARITLTANASGTLNVRGLPLPPTLDQSARFVSGFDDPVEFSQAEANLVGGTLALTVIEAPLAIVDSVPPHGAIDAAQPSELDGLDSQGWTAIVLTFSSDPADLAITDLLLTQEGGTTPPPTITAIGPLGDNQLGVELDGPVAVGAWTTLTHVPSNSAVRLGFLPADVNGDGTSSPLDILALIDALNGIGETPLPAWSTDVNRSGITEPLDILRTIDLLNGAGAYSPWNGVTLP